MSSTSDFKKLNLNPLKYNSLIYMRQRVFLRWSPLHVLVCGPLFLSHHHLGHIPYSSCSQRAGFWEMSGCWQGLLIQMRSVVWVPQPPVLHLSRLKSCSLFCLSLLVSQPEEKPEETCSKLMFTLLGEAQKKVSVRAIVLQGLPPISNLPLAYSLPKRLLTDHKNNSLSDCPIWRLLLFH